MPDRITIDNRLPEDHRARSLRADATAGLTADPKSLPPKWFYDAHGSVLFDRITRLPEYYPTRAERMILRAHAEEIARLSGARTLVELGSGSSDKTRLLLDALTAAGSLKHYAPVDVSEAALADAADALCRDYPDLRVAATVTDFEADLALPEAGGPRLIAFLGSTLGNFVREQRAAFLARLRAALTSEGDALLLGLDLVKDPKTLVRAYDDDQGVTAAFNKNVLRVLNRELRAEFDLGAYDHRAVWDPEAEHIEMRLRARVAHQVKIPALDLTVDFGRGEDLRTEISAKFRRETVTEELAAAGLELAHWWTDPQSRFALLLATPAAAPSLEDPPQPSDA
ncbi:L-histidine N(alpha)-methyltransferase [Streptomyces sp. DSM 44917]|uniref:Histidine N-alpha-methyltransferase n=1 Tax=Streptomyces boetiae TaxID=3075541 RepID=A0ABU2LDT1_9ACTN|nr:L-histidine N(alpha)-methyltransferase [Streptomyces sp. DSM 44917]MDT0309338.1 L-histidine N(alpha)-methyltransferase [Streptomyces sp. DSM 44917]